jgi:RimJ/RimL family protein N-acetyltransferase
VRLLTTPRLRLEPVTVDNAVTLWRVMQSGQLRQYQDVPKLSQDEFIRRVAGRPQKFNGRAVGRFEWLLFVGVAGPAVGWVSLRVADHESSVAEIGYSLITGARGKGYAAEAVRAIVDVAFDDGAMARIDACCVPENLASRRVLQRIGFIQLKVQPNGAVVRGRPVDVCLYALSRREWERLRFGASSG